MLSFRQYLKEEKKGHKFHGNQYTKVLSSHFQQHDVDTPTAEQILETKSKADREEIADKIKQANSLTPSIDQYSKVVNGKHVWTEERKKLHRKIISDILTPEAIKKATPANGQKPTFIILGGRGGSGKSAFTNGKVKEFDASKFIVLDSDHIKESLIPPYEGWNAAQVHAESSYIFDIITKLMKRKGLNFVHDSTLKTKKVEDAIIEMKNSGYRIEGHYMHVPRKISAARALDRYLGEGPHARKRLVPVEVILQNTDNEKNFEDFQKYFDRWSAYDNQVEKGQLPKLISRSK